MVDDDIDDINLTKDAFESLKANVKFSFVLKADKIIHYLDAYAGENNIHLILLDLNMPGIDGKAVLQQLKSNKKYNSIPVAVFTTSTSDTDRKECMQLKANLFVTKPSNFEQLKKLMGSFCLLYMKESLFNKPAASS